MPVLRALQTVSGHFYHLKGTSTYHHTITPSHYIFVDVIYTARMIMEPHPSTGQRQETNQASCSYSLGTSHTPQIPSMPTHIHTPHRRGADRAQCDGSGRTALDHAQEKGHNECVRILQTYGLRRSSSSLSLASHISLPTHGGAPPTYDEQGHVMLQRPNRLQSFFLPRLPGDGRDDQVSRDYTPSTPSRHTHTLARLLCCCIHRNNTVAPTN